MSKHLMRNALVACSLSAVALCGLSGIASAEPKIGAPAPAFTGSDTAGKTHDLAEFKGKTVVLEWTNHDCPFVGKHYNSGNMQALQKKWTEDGVVWLSVISSAPGTQGAVSPAEADQLTKEREAAPTAVLLDTSGTIGKAYGAQTTPHMYVIDKGGSLVYMGGIDDKPSTRPADIKTAKNYVDAALTEVAAGKPVSMPATRAYGCTVKYSS